MISIRILAGPALGAALAAVSVAAFAQTPLDQLDDHSAKRLDRMEQALKEIRAIVFQGRETGKPVVVVPADTDAQLTSLSQKLDALQQTVTQLTGQLESATHDVDAAHKEADALREENGALTARVAALEQKATQPTEPPPLATSAPEPAAPPADPAATFAAARTAFNAGDYATAEAGFRDVAKRAEGTPRAMEARYYVAKILIGREAYADAASLDLDVVRQWPQASWAPDAALDLARAMIGLKETKEACGVLAGINTHYPKAGPGVRAVMADVRSEARCQAAG